MARRERRRRWVGLRVFDVAVILSVIALLGVSLAALLATTDSPLVDRTQQWLRAAVDQLAPVASVSRAEALLTGRADEPER